MDKKIVIKKYENRRLYDVTHSRYVNLDEIARFVQDGYDVQVLDASSGEDITRLVMTQIITECAKAPDSVFPLDILREMVVASGKATQQSALNYMRTVADLYKNAWQGIAQPANPFDMMRYMMNSTQAAQATQPPPASAPEAHAEARVSKAGDTNAEADLQELKRRLQELESLVSKTKVSPTRKKQSKARKKS